MPVRQQRPKVTKPKPTIIPIRLKQDEDADLREAAARLSQPVSVFIRSVAVLEARRILAA